MIADKHTPDCSGQVSRQAVDRVLQELQLQLGRAELKLHTHQMWAQRPLRLSAILSDPQSVPRWGPLPAQLLGPLLAQLSGPPPVLLLGRSWVRLWGSPWGPQQQRARLSGRLSGHPSALRLSALRLLALRLPANTVRHAMATRA